PYFGLSALYSTTLALMPGVALSVSRKLFNWALRKGNLPGSTTKTITSPFVPIRVVVSSASTCPTALCRLVSYLGRPHWLTKIQVSEAEIPSPAPTTVRPFWVTSRFMRISFWHPPVALILSRETELRPPCSLHSGRATGTCRGTKR